MKGHVTRSKRRDMRDQSKRLWQLPNVGDVRQVGVVMGVELVRNWQPGSAFKLIERAGIRACDAMARRGVLTRSIGNVVVVMPPLLHDPAPNGDNF